MLSAYVLIQTQVGKVAHVAHTLSDLDGVELAEDMFSRGGRQYAPSDQRGRSPAAWSATWNRARWPTTS